MILDAQLVITSWYPQLFDCPKHGLVPAVIWPDRRGNLHLGCGAKVSQEVPRSTNRWKGECGIYDKEIYQYSRSDD